MVWYNIQKNRDEYVVFKNVESRNAIGAYGKFHGTREECVKYCRKNKIKLNKKVAI